MAWSDYWNGLSGGQRLGLGLGAAAIVTLAAALSFWLLHDPYVPLASGLEAQRVNEISQELERAKVEYRVEGGGEAIEIPRSQLGKARAALAAGPYDLPPNVGLELFQESDFSLTDFAQRINYQRALQGELTRTIQTIAGVRSARVHVILPDGGLLKRNAAKATAAVTLSLQPEMTLSRAQVSGIQRLVAASVPQIAIDDVVVLDELGQSLSQAHGEGDSMLSSAQLDLKRQADQYFEGKLQRLLQQLMPHGQASLSVDATLDERQLRVTTEEPLATRTSKDGTHVAGVLVKERQSQRGSSPGLMQTDTYANESDSRDWEYEYKVGNRVEQMLSSPGSIKRISVAVALQGAPSELSAAAIEELVARAVGVDRTRGDAVTVLLLPKRVESQVPLESMLPERADERLPPVARSESPRSYTMAVVFAAIGLLLLALLTLQLLRKQPRVSNVDEEAVLAKVQQWLQEAEHGRR